MRDGTYVDPLWTSGVVPLACLGLAIFILGACFIWNAERRRDRTQQRHNHTTERDQERAL